MTRQPKAALAVMERRHLAHGIEYVFRASRLANLSWQLDCLAGLHACSRAAYEELWGDTLRDRTGLRSALRRWAELRSRNRGPVGELSPTSPTQLPLPKLNPDLWQRVRLASLSAPDTAHYESILYALTDRSTAKALRDVVEEFDASFDGLWRRALPELERAIGEQRTLQARSDVGLTIRRVADFYGADLGRHPQITFDMLFRPEHVSPTHATQVLDRGLIEVVSSEPPALRIQVPLHELFHFLFASAPHDRLERLAQRFAGSTNPDALAAYGLLDEVLATGLAQGVLGRRLTPEQFQQKLAAPRRLFADEFVDAVAKALLPTLEEIVTRPDARDAVFSAEFHAAYLGAVARAYPNGLPPGAHLRPLACAYSKELESAYRTLHARSGARLVASTAEPDTEEARALLEERHTWGRGLLLKPDQLGSLRRYNRVLGAADVLEIARAARRGASFAYANRVPGTGPVFVLVADDHGGAEALLQRFFELGAMFSGLALEVPREKGRANAN
ncbi:MAG TPA: hypothetical protein VIM73_12620 [Polyangiaceae bacterium]